MCRNRITGATVRARCPESRPSRLAGIPGRPDIALVSLGTTFGWRHADAALAAMIAQAGYRCEVRPLGVGLAHRLRRTMAMVDLVEGLAARRAAAGIDARAVIYCSITAALLAPAGRPHAIRFDTVAAQSRPGPTGLWQRRREPSVLARAELLLPWSDAAARAAHDAIGPRRRPRTITLPVPIEPLSGAPIRDIAAVAYCANPHKRGLEILCRAWLAAAPPGAELLIGGVEAPLARAHLAETATPEPANIRWAGERPREEWLGLVGRARIFINASRYEDWGIGQLEALSSGTALVTVPSAGPNEALPLARVLAPALVAPAIEAAPLATAIAAGLALDDAQRADYAGRAAAALARYRPDRVGRQVADEVVPALLASSA